MYCVVSHWRPKPGMLEEFKSRASKARAEIAELPGVKSVYGFLNEETGGPTAMMVYESKDVYEKLVNAPGGPFERISEKYRLEDAADWVSSERGETID